MNKVKETEITEVGMFSETALKNVKDLLRYHAVQNHVHYVDMKVSNANTRITIDLVTEDFPEV